MGWSIALPRSAVDDSLAKDKVDVTAHLKVRPIGDAVRRKKTQSDAMTALLAAYPEMRKPFHGVGSIAEVPGQNPFATEQAMARFTSGRTAFPD